MDRTVLALSLWQRLENWDKWLFVKINGQFTNHLFDAVFPYLRDPFFWAPVYIFLLIFVNLNYGKKGLWWSLFFLCTVALTDGIGSKLFKEVFERSRPCNDPTMADHVRLLLRQCGTGFSFVSNHAANHFGMATFAVLTFRGNFGKWIYFAYAWAFLVGYAQVYVGVHYPLDVLGGAGLGVLAGVLTATVFHRMCGSIHMDQQIR
jgi:undecaprenyl-diphosphatase